jgi:WD40 repeat protein
VPVRKNLVAELLASLLVLLGITIAIPLNIVSGYFPSTITGHRFVWICIAVAAATLVVILTWHSQRHVKSSPAAMLWQVPTVTGWVDRVELTEVVSALTAASTGAVALTTGLIGAGGFGKTTLAARTCQEAAIRRRFSGGIVWVTVGRDTNGVGLAAQITEVIRNVGTERPTFTSPEQAGYALAAALAQRGRTLLVADDVWTADQLQPFLAVGRSGRLLVTTRRPVVLADPAARRIRVDEMNNAVARRLLTRDLPQMLRQWERELLDLTGGWPILLNLVNRRLVEELLRQGGTIDAAASYAISRLREAGPSALDLTDSGSRQTAVTATINYSLDALEPSQRDRFFELGIFAEDSEIPVALVALLWQRCANFDKVNAEELCERLDGLSLLSLAWAGDMRVVVLHDVIRDYAASRLSVTRRTALHAALVDAARDLAGPVKADKSNGPVQAESQTAWWRLPEDPQYAYLWRNITYHLKEAELYDELNNTCCDIRFVTMKLIRSGPAAAEVDLARGRSGTARRLQRAIARNAHLLGPVQPATAMATILTSRLGGVSEVVHQLHALRSDLHAWTAWPDDRVPDEPPDALIHILTDHKRGPVKVVISADGSWLATNAFDETTRMWDPDGSPRAVLSSQSSYWDPLVIAPDGTWLVTSSRGPARIWGADGSIRGVLAGHSGSFNAVAVAPDGSWLVAASSEGTTRIWAVDGTIRAVLRGHTDRVRAVAIASDGTWLATGASDGTTRIWRPDGSCRAVLDHGSPLQVVAVSPDGSWLATGGSATVRIWSADGNLQGTLPDNGILVASIAISPDSSWLAVGGSDGQAFIWGVDGSRRAVLSGHGKYINAVAISPQGRWLATGASDGAVRIWTVDGTLYAVLAGHSGIVNSIAISPDGTWLATGAGDATARIWAAESTAQPRQNEAQKWVKAVAISPDGSCSVTGDREGVARVWAADGSIRARLSGHIGPVNAVAFVPDGSWLITGGNDGTVRIWEPNGALKGAFRCHRNPISGAAISPDGTWLATASWDGTAKIWTVDGHLKKTLRGHTGSVDAVAIAPDGTWIATASGDKTARIWAADGSLRATLTGHTDFVNAVAISPDGTWLATASDDKTARVWAADGSFLGSLTGHSDVVTAVAISPNGAFLATVSEDKTVRIWTADLTSLPVECATMIRVDSPISSCAWNPETSLCIAGDLGIYHFSLKPPTE